jgi:hypothetical protein
MPRSLKAGRRFLRRVSALCVSLLQMERRAGSVVVVAVVQPPLMRYLLELRGPHIVTCRRVSFQWFAVSASQMTAAHILSGAGIPGDQNIMISS